MGTRDRDTDASLGPLGDEWYFYLFEQMDSDQLIWTRWM